ncbi:MAG: hypothetical protein ACRYFZ_15920 [Janthinobacterium lividum]
MQLTVSIVRFNTSFRSGVDFYSVVLPNEVEHETKKFFSRFQTDEFALHIREMRALIQTIGVRGNALLRFFREEDNAYALPGHDYSRPKFRLYCVRCCPTVVILGNGGVKTSQFARDSPDCYPHLLLMDAIATAFNDQGIDCCNLPRLPLPFSLTITLP